MTHLAGYLADPTPIVQATRLAGAPLHRQILSFIHDPLWSDLGEEYIVFQLTPGDHLPPLLQFLNEHAAWLAGLVSLEAAPLSPSAVAEALRQSLSYSPDDLFVADWPAAVLIDRECDETLQAIEFANLQLLEYRHIDQRLDTAQWKNYRVIQRLSHSWLPFWRRTAAPPSASSGGWATPLDRPAEAFSFGTLAPAVVHLQDPPAKTANDKRLHAILLEKGAYERRRILTWTGGS